MKKLVGIDTICREFNIKKPRAYELARLWESSDGTLGLPCIRLGTRQLRFILTEIDEVPVQGLLPLSNTIEEVK